MSKLNEYLLSFIMIASVACVAMLVYLNRAELHDFLVQFQ